VRVILLWRVFLKKVTWDKFTNRIT
jgi:hypothetical protein